MNPHPYPLQAVALGPDGVPWYPFRTPDTDAVLFAQEPVLPTATAVWATIPSEYADRPHVDLDEKHLAEVFYLALYEIDLDTVTAEQMPGILNRRLRACGCDGDRLDGWCDIQPIDVMSRRLMNRCLQLSHRLLAA